MGLTTSGLGSTLTTISNFLTSAIADPSQLPAVGRNPLHQFQSYNCLFTLACLDRNQQNSTSIDKSSIKNIIARSQGDWQYYEKRVATEFGSFDYFIDDVVIANLPSMSIKSGNSFATKITFKVTEPYSMGLFLLALQRAASQAGYTTNFREAPYLFMIEFAGYINDTPTSVETTSDLTRFIPIKIIDVKFRVTNAGSVYECEAIPYNELGFRDHMVTVSSDINISGNDVKSLLAQGDNSLESQLRKFGQTQISSKNLKNTDQYFIQFPEEWTEPSGQNNIISGSKIYSKLDTQGSVPFPDNQDIFDQVKQIYKNRSLTINEKHVWNFKQGAKIPDIITEVIIRSDYIANQLTNSELLLDPKGMINWFRIETQIIDGEENVQFGRQNRFIIYRVVPYKVHVSKFVPPNTQPPGFNALRQTVVRVYDYIYSGKNSDILNLDINFDMAFFTPIPSDISNRVGQNNSGQSGLEAGGTKPINTLTNQGSAPKTGEVPTSSSPNALPQYQSQGPGGGSSDTPQTSQARTLQAILSNPADLLEINFEIIGDPYYLPSSGMGNQIKQPTGDNIMADGSMNYQSSEVDIILNFRTPIDLDPVSGRYKFVQTIDQWSGLYRILEIESKFSHNKFTQVIKAVRRRPQLEGTASRKTIFTQEGQ